jgi:hypothetical protein
VICDRALLGAFAVSHPSPIPKKIVKQAVNEVIGNRRTRESRFSFSGIPARMFFYAFSLVVLTLVGWYSFKTFSVTEGGAEKFEISYSSQDTAGSTPFPKENVGLSLRQASVSGPATRKQRGFTGSQTNWSARSSMNYEASRLSAIKTCLRFGKTSRIECRGCQEFLYAGRIPADAML